MYFMCLGGSRGIQILTIPRRWVGPLPKHLRLEGSEALRLAEACVLRVLEALGGSSVRVSRVREALAGSNL